MRYDLTAMTGTPWPFEAAARIGETCQRALLRMTDLQLDLYRRNLDTLLEHAGNAAAVWKESGDAYLALLDSCYQDDIKNPVTVTKSRKAAKNKTAAALKRAKPRSSAARKRPSSSSQ